MPDDRPPARGPDDEPSGEQREALAPDQRAQALVWPPTDDELAAWEVVPLHDPAQPSTPPATVPPADPVPVSPTPAGPAARGAVVVRAAPRSMIPPRGERREPSAPGISATSKAVTERRSAHLAAPRSTMSILVVVPLLAVLSAAAGFAAALWIGPRLLSDTALQAEPAVLIVESREPGSRVLVNGEPWGTTPLRLSMTGGETRIEIEPAPTTSTSSATTPGGIRPTAGVLRESPPGEAPGSVLIRSTPPGARVVLMGRFQGLTPVSVGGIPPGLHDVQIAGASGTALRRVNVRAGRLSTLEVDLQGAGERPAVRP